MLVISTKGWAKLLNTYTSRKIYNNRPDKVTLNCSTGENTVAKFEKLASIKNLLYCRPNAWEEAISNVHIFYDWDIH